MQTQHSKFEMFLQEQYQRYMSKIQRIFGPRDTRFDLGSISRAPENKPNAISNDGPYIFFPENQDYMGNCPINIYISRTAWDNAYCDQAAWQVAHECVHLIDPVKSEDVTFLEEGLAVWFQNQPENHLKPTKNYLAQNKHILNENDEFERKYIEAERIVNSLMPQLARAIKKIRNDGNTRISDIKPEKLQPYLRRDASIQDIYKLCSLFHPNVEEKKVNNMDDIEYPEVQFTMPDGKNVTGYEIPIEDSSEKFNEYTLGDGTKIRAKLVVTGARRVKDQWNKDGNPAYYIEHNAVIRVYDSHTSLKKK